MDSTETNMVDTSASIGNDDIDNIIQLQDDIDRNCSEHTGKRKRKLTSEVWTLFERLPIDQFSDGKQRTKCIKCGIVYICPSTSGTGNMKKHMITCPKLSMPRDPRQMFIDHALGSVSVRDPKFDPNVYRQLLCSALVKHDLPFQFVEYEGIINVHKYLEERVPTITRNTAKSDVLKMYKSGKEKIICMLEDILGRISFNL